MKCFVHIGTEKTGTSTIQEFLNLNRRSLAGLNVLYPKSAGIRNHVKLALAAYNDDRQDDNKNAPRRGPGHLPDQLRKELVRKFEADFCSGPPYVLPLQLQEQYAAAFESGNEWVRQQYFPDQTALFVRSDPTEPDNPGMDAKQIDQMATYVSGLWNGIALAAQGAVVPGPGRIVGWLLRVRSWLLARRAWLQMLMAFVFAFADTGFVTNIDGLFPELLEA